MEDNVALSSSRLINWHHFFYFLINGKMHNLKRQTDDLHSIQSDLHSEGDMTGQACKSTWNFGANPAFH